ncbi:MAG: [protein-PII] uridylyltransferase [Nitrospirota bacterium]
MNGLNNKRTTPDHAAIKAFLAEEESLVKNAHFSGARGDEIVQRRTALIDHVLKAIYQPLDAEGPLPLLVAIGGYGRGELNPHSDIDILLLCRDEQDRQQAPRMLYALWDAGLDIGYSVRTVSECVDLSRNDHKIRTSLLESRLLAGDHARYDAFLQRMQAEVFYRKPQGYITEKIAERSATRQKFGGSVYLREPNIKESAGGLRDFHTARWLAMTHFRVSSFDGLVSQGVITAAQHDIFRRSRNFLWRLRNEVHYLTGRKNDHLTFDLQETAAQDFHYRNSAHLLAVERFMKSYFLHARNIQEFSRILTERVLPAPKRSWFDRSLPLGPFTLVGKTLAPASDDALCSDPGLFLEAFEAFQTRHAVFSDRLKQLILTCRFGDPVRTSRQAAEKFLAILNNPDRLSGTLWLMKDLKYLGRYLPEFRAIQALARRDYYHTYTVDEHILTAIRSLEDVWQGRYPGLSTLFEAFKKLSRRWVLMLTVLLHDLGKAYRTGHELRGREIAEGVLDRLGVSGQDRDRILFLIENHLLMSTLSQRRELSDRKVIADFAATVGDAETLAMLYLLTYADLSAVSPAAWTTWKASLLQDLYLRTLGHFEASGREEDEMKKRVAAAAKRLADAAAGSFSAAEIDRFIASMPDHYLVATSEHRQMEHLGMVRRLEAEQLVITHRHLPDRGYTELTVCAYDAYGMFYRTAGTIAAQNLNILRAQVYTAKNGIMIDTFQITDAQGRISRYEDVWKTVIAGLRDVLMGRRRPPEPSSAPTGSAAAAAVPASVAFDNSSSETLTIIDITARDRVGLLYRITRTLYDLNLDIASAKIATEGLRVTDAFYVSDLFRAKIVDPERLAKIRDALLKVLE